MAEAMWTAGEGSFGIIHPHGLPPRFYPSLNRESDSIPSGVSSEGGQVEVAADTAEGSDGWARRGRLPGMFESGPPVREAMELEEEPRTSVQYDPWRDALDANGSHRDAGGPYQPAAVWPVAFVEACRLPRGFHPGGARPNLDQLRCGGARMVQEDPDRRSPWVPAGSQPRMATPVRTLESLPPGTARRRWHAVGSRVIVHWAIEFRP